MAATDNRPPAVSATAHAPPPSTYAPRQAAPIRSGMPRRIDIADVTPNNVGQLRKLNSVLFPVRFSERWYKDVLDAQVSDVSKFALFNDIPVGNVCCRFERQENKEEVKLYIMTLGCLAPYRRIGVASKLLEHVLEHGGPGKTVTLQDSDKAKDEGDAASAAAKKGGAQANNNKKGTGESKKKGEERKVIAVYLHVQTGNDEAKLFYERHGFVQVEQIEEYYHRGIEPRSAWVLEKRQ